MTENEKVQAHIAYRAEKIDKMRRQEARRAFLRTLLPWKNSHGEVTVSTQVQMREFEADCDRHWEELNA